MYRRISHERSAQLLRAIMINNFDGWLRLPITNLVDRQDIIRFCCSRSWQADHILRALFALNQIEHSGNHIHIERDVGALPKQPYGARDKLYTLACSGDFRGAVAAGLDLIKGIVIMADVYYPEIRAESFLIVHADTDVGLLQYIPTIEQRKRLAQATAEAYTCIQGIRGMIVEGSLAKGTADMTSDIDLRAYCKVIPDIDTRRACAHILDENSQIIPESDRLTIDDVYVHIDFESVDSVESTFAAFPYPPWWAPATWEPIQVGEIVWDPEFVVQKWKDMISNMPSEPKKNLIAALLRHLYDKEQRLHAAIDDNDPIYCSILLGHILSFYFQVLGIINGRFIIFPKWMHQVVPRLDHKPDNMYDRFCAMLSRDLYQDTLTKLADELQTLLSDLLTLVEEFYPESASMF